MVQEHSIRAALHAEAGQARVPTEEILKRIRKAGAIPRRSVLPQGFRFRQVAEVAVACALLSLLFLLPTLRGGHAPSSAPAGVEPSRLLTYENETLGVRLSFPVSFDTPEIDDLGRLVLRFGEGLLLVSRHEGALQPSGDLAMVRTDVLQPVEQGQRMLAGRMAEYARYPTGELYLVMVENSEYLVECQAVPGATQAAWASLQPVCGRVLSTLELGVKLLVSQDEAETAAVAAVPGDVLAVRAVLEGHGDEKAVPPPVWRVFLVTRDGRQAVGSVTVDSRTGRVLTVEVKQP